MAFDISTARPESGAVKFDISTARPETQKDIQSVAESDIFQELVGAGVPEDFAKKESKRLAVERGASRATGEFVAGLPEVAATIASSAVLEPVAGLAGIGAALAPGGRTGAEAVESVRGFGFQPRTEAGKGALQTIGSGVSAVLEPAQNVVDALAGAAGESIGPRAEAAVSSFIPAAAQIGAELLGIKGARKIPISTTNKKIASALAENPSSKKLVRYIRDGSGRVSRDRQAIESIKQGFDEGVIAAVKGSSNVDRMKMKRMTKVLEKGMDDAKFSIKNRPTDIVGDSLLERLNHVKQVNRAAGRQLDGVAKSLKGKRVDFEDAIAGFNDDLSGMGITLSDVDGRLTPNFKGSIIEGIKGPENAVKQIVDRLDRAGTMDAFDIHRMKKFIDENVTFGKSAEGLGGKTENVLKSFRRGLDQSLDNQLPRYKNVNDRFSETRGAIDSLQDAAGKKLDLFGKNANKATGTLLRRVLSNAQSRVNLIDAIDEVESVARRTGATFQDDLLSQVLFADELEKVFGPASRTSLAGEVSKGVRGAQRAAEQSALSTGVDVAASLVERARGINPDNALRSINKVLER
jgi:hypothetical protein